MLLRIDYKDNDFWDCFHKVAQEIASYTESDIKQLIERHGITDFKNRIIESAYHFRITSKPFNHKGYFYREISYQETLLENEHLLDYFQKTDVSVVKKISDDDWNGETVYVKFYADGNIVEMH